MDRALSYDDVLLVPQLSDIESRSDVNLSTCLGKLNLQIPVVSSPMSTVSERAMVIAMAKMGGLGIMHRFMPVSQQVEWIRDIQLFVTKEQPFGFSIGVKETLDRFYKSVEAVNNRNRLAICIDVAHGDHTAVIALTKRIAKELPEVTLIAGNVATKIGTRNLFDAGADCVRVGIGAGSMCTTRIVTRHGLPALTSIDLAASAVGSMVPDSNRNYSLIADGGIRNSGDAAIALAAGADVVMLGRILSGTEESPGQIVDGKKLYAGMASNKSRQMGGIKIDSKIATEGIHSFVDYKGSVYDVMDEFLGGLKSALSYSGARNIKQFQENAVFVEVSPSSQVESTPHGATHR
jgi:IMP dehydrogenase